MFCKKKGGQGEVILVLGKCQRTNVPLRHAFAATVSYLSTEH